MRYPSEPKQNGRFAPPCNVIDNRAGLRHPCRKTGPGRFPNTTAANGG